MTLETRLNAYRAGELTLGQVLDSLPSVSDRSLALADFLDALEAGSVPGDVIEAWSHPEGDLARHAHLHAYRRALNVHPEAAPTWRMLPKQFAF